MNAPFPCMLGHHYGYKHAWILHVICLCNPGSTFPYDSRQVVLTVSLQTRIFVDGKLNASPSIV